MQFIVMEHDLILGYRRPMSDGVREIYRKTTYLTSLNEFGDFDFGVSFH